MRSAGEQDVIECQYHCVILCMMTKQTGEGRWARCPRGRLKISFKTEISRALGYEIGVIIEKETAPEADSENNQSEIDKLLG